MQPLVGEDLAVTNRPSAANDVATLMMQGTAMSKTVRHGDAAAEVTCEALELALSVIHLEIAWHAGVISSEAAMESLYRQIGMTIGRFTRSPRTRSPEASDGSFLSRVRTDDPR